jgi:hypothetical protein
MIIIKEEISDNRICLSQAEVQQLLDNLQYGISESKDHNLPFPVTIIASNSRKLEIWINP